jgi:hypothetical protein
LIRLNRPIVEPESQLALDPVRLTLGAFTFWYQSPGLKPAAFRERRRPLEMGIARMMIRGRLLIRYVGEETRNSVALAVA